MSGFSLPRRDLLRGGALVVGFALAGPALGQAPRGPAGPPPATPDPGQVDTWLAIHKDNTATLYLGFVELGQGTTTALPQVAAEELDLDLDQVRVAPAETNVTPNQGGTYSSASIARGSPQVRAAAAEARQALLAMAAERLKTPVDQLMVSRGMVFVIGDKGRHTVTYGQLIGDRRFELKVSGKAPVKPPEQYRLVGTKAPRHDIAAKMKGEHLYIQHERLPGMLHARVVRPPGQPAYGAGAKVLSLDAGSVGPEVRVLRRGDFIAVAAEREWDAVKAARALKVVWDAAPSLPPPSQLYERMRSGPTTDTVVLQRGDSRAALAGAAETVSMTCRGPYQSHATFAPGCAVADVRASEALVISTSQDIYNLRRELAPILGLPEAKIRVQFRDASGTYGHSCYDDVAQAAAIASQLAGRPAGRRWPPPVPRRHSSCGHRCPRRRGTAPGSWLPAGRGSAPARGGGCRCPGWWRSPAPRSPARRRRRSPGRRWRATGRARDRSSTPSRRRRRGPRGSRPAAAPRCRWSAPSACARRAATAAAGWGRHPRPPSGRGPP